MPPDAASTDHVYRRLKAEIMAGRYIPGSVLNVHQIAVEIGVSISPVRDAIERMVGERMLATRSGGGFQMPAFTEASLRDLYLWHSYLARGAVRAMPALTHADELAEILDAIEPDDDHAIVAATSRFFLELGAAAGNSEHIAAIHSIGERLAVHRLAERRLRDRKLELGRLLTLSVSGTKSAMKGAISVYHRRRLRHLTALIHELYSVGAVFKHGEETDNSGF